MSESSRRGACFTPLHRGHGKRTRQSCLSRHGGIAQVSDSVYASTNPRNRELFLEGKNINRMAEQYDQYPSMLAGDFHSFFRGKERRLAEHGSGLKARSALIALVEERQFDHKKAGRVVKSLTSGRRFGKAKSRTSSVREEYRVAGKCNSTEGIGEIKSTKSKDLEPDRKDSSPRFGDADTTFEESSTHRFGGKTQPLNSKPKILLQ
ncbi:hypothetical protein FNV43_RR08311 [Rhamnella rubrinervis]|uniref:Uncharacterized protein n=1 Tax=Rhamnella rubrinervis TaxID=2594499 RepID=A0A8K0MNI9_9ROSA|nr:hypothetical protein FNV43_RR08311 [Rhamnella rubrinervis]